MLGLLPPLASPTPSVGESCPGSRLFRVDSARISRGWMGPSPSAAPRSVRKRSARLAPHASRRTICYPGRGSRLRNSRSSRTTSVRWVRKR